MTKKATRNYRLFIPDPTYQGNHKYIKCKDADEIRELDLIQKTQDAVLSRVLADSTYLRELMRR